NLSVFNNKKTSQKMRVNYASLNVEEFGSVYEGMLEYDPVITKYAGVYQFDLVKGSARSSSGSHYTPDELVQPLIKHSLDYIIDDNLKSSDKKSEKEKALLSIKVCDVACGSGHILLNAARRIGAELAKVRTNEDQPSPAPLRLAIRDVIKSCIYGVDKNRLAVELCKVSLWLEAHNPGEPLNFLDHHIKWGDAIVGLAHKEELENGIADEAFKKMPGDDKDIRVELAKRNKRERKSAEKRKIFYEHSEFGSIDRSFTDISKVFESFNRLPENSIKEIEHKRREYKKLVSRDNWWHLKTLSDIQVAQFFIPKTEDNAKKIIADDTYQAHLSGRKPLEGSVAVAKAMGVAAEKRFFHWFLEFPEVFARGGFDCILGNPPFLGNRRLKGAFGTLYLNWLTFAYAPAGAIDLVGYFFRRNFSLIKNETYLGLISTNTIAQGVTREGSLDVIEQKGGTINFAIRSMPWPGQAAVSVSLLAIKNGNFFGKRNLDGNKVDVITTYLDDSEDLAKPYPLMQNSDKSFIGSYVLGKGFVISHEKAHALIEKDSKNRDVLFPYLIGKDLNSQPDQSPSRWIINFFDWPIEKTKEYLDCFRIIEERVKPERTRLDKNGNFKLRKPLPQKWWIYADKRPKLYSTIKILERVLVVAQVSKTVAFEFTENDKVLDAKLIVFALDRDSVFAFLQSGIHYNWAWKYCTTMKADLSYTPTAIFQTFPFPQNASSEIKEQTELTGKKYHGHRRQLMLKMQLGLTKTYNQFHNPDLREFSNDDIAIISTMKDKEFQKQYGKETVNLWKHLKKTEGVYTFNEAVKDILRLRKLHKQMDETVLKAYGWTDINLAHDFYEV
ncbi:MAG: Eco57I restriction-modification methylase domain-containing protein, partial [Desulfobacterales bacterium]